MRNGPAIVIAMLILAFGSGLLLVIGGRCVDDDGDEPPAHYSAPFEIR